MARHRSNSARRSGDAANVEVPVTATADDRGVLTGWSEGARRLLGHTGDQVLGTAAADLLADAPPALAWPGPEAGDRRDCPVTLRHRDGHRIEGHLLARRRAAHDGAEWLLV